jgi:RNA polymerase sigma factor (sigma-70 family)
MPAQYLALSAVYRSVDEALSRTWMSEQDRQISAAVAREQHRLRGFIRKWVADEGEVEDILQDVFYELVEAFRVAQPIEQVGAWMFRVARNRITDLFRRRRSAPLQAGAVENQDGEPLPLADLLPSPAAGPEAAYARGLLLDELAAALDELPPEQREVFLAHEVEGHSFKEIAAETGVGINTLLSRKHYAVLHLRRRLRAIHDDFLTS